MNEVFDEFVCTVEKCPYSSTYNSSDPLPCCSCENLVQVEQLCIDSL